MSLYGMMRTGVSGMNAQVNRLSAVADNIANASTVGYKRADTQFSSLVLPSTNGQYNSGSVQTEIRYGISQQGGLRGTASTTDLAIDGNGFFVVSDKNGTTYLTRAGSFVKDQDGNLMNAAGHYLMGYTLASNGQVELTANGTGGLQKINVADPKDPPPATASQNGRFTVNLPANADVITGTPPSANASDAEYSSKTSLVSYDGLGNKILLDVYFSKTADQEWEVAVFNSKDAASGGGFPYSSAAMSTGSMQFDPQTGSLIVDPAAVPPTVGGLEIPMVNGVTLTLDLSGTKQLANEYTIYEAMIDGGAPSKIESVDVGSDGKVVARYADGTQKALFQIAMGKVETPDKMDVHSGNVFTANAKSGNITYGVAESAGMGKISSGALEESNADIAQELTEMIEAQRSYTANSKVFQTGSELMDVLVNLKR